MPYETPPNDLTARLNSHVTKSTVAMTTAAHLRLVVGLFVSLCGSVCFTGLTYSSRQALTGADRSFQAPYLFCYIITALSHLAFYPVYVIVRLLWRRGQVSVRDLVRYV